ncbi:hypothetical protein ACFOD9_14225 [Novosphingobium bradum]|uniref:Uncharacterized protein n=1 Tax=Novosphingobium bradum TaxID=1737444 RepID=A0ABV7IRU8_9SPHN
MANWVNPAEAVQSLARLHEMSGRLADFDVCLNAAEETLLARLASGQVPTRASFVEYTSTEEFLVTKTDEAVPKTFWRNWVAARPIDREADWIVGDFRYDHGADWSDLPCWGKAFGVAFEASALPWMDACQVAPENSSRIVELESALDEMTTEVVRLQGRLIYGPPQTSALPSRSGKGRPAANWWPAFAEELAVYLHDSGPPQGTGTEGQSEMLAEIFRRMNERGHGEPSRSTVQPVINAVLQRVR